MLTQYENCLWHHDTLGDVWARPGQTAAQIMQELDAANAPAALAAQSAAAKRAAINTERESRIAAGAAVTVSGAGSIPVQGREADVRNLQGLGLMALARVSAGDTATMTTFRDANNIDHELTPPQVLELVRQASAAAEAIIQASWAIKAMDPLPADVTDDGLWPE